MRCLYCRKLLPITDASPVCINTKECQERLDAQAEEKRLWLEGKKLPDYSKIERRLDEDHNQQG